MTDTKKKIIVERLITCFDRSIRHEKEVIFESESYEYYKKYVKPDKLILNTLKECIEIIESKKLTEE